MHPEVVSDKPGVCPICGMALEPMTASLDDAPNAELLDMRRRFVISLIFSIPLLLLGMAEMFGIHGLATQPWLPWIELALATPVVLWCGWPFFVRAAASIVSRHLNMFTFIGMGTGAAYLYSVAATLFPNAFPASFRTMGVLPLYYEPAAEGAAVRRSIAAARRSIAAARRSIAAARRGGCRSAARHSRSAARRVSQCGAAQPQRGAEGVAVRRSTAAARRGGCRSAARHRHSAARRVSQCGAAEPQCGAASPQRGPKGVTVRRSIAAARRGGCRSAARHRHSAARRVSQCGAASRRCCASARRRCASVQHCCASALRR